jgi:hypothetical protein
MMISEELIVRMWMEYLEFQIGHYASIFLEGFRSTTDHLGHDTGLWAGI